MVRFAPIGHYDLSSFFAAYTAKHKRGLLATGSPLHVGARFLPLVTSGERETILSDWKSADTLLHKIETMLGQLPQPAVLTNAFVLALDPMGFEQWHIDDQIDPESFMRVHLPLHPAPALRLYSGPDVLAPLAWQAVVVDHRGLISQTNFAAPTVAHQLILELALDAGA